MAAVLAQIAAAAPRHATLDITGLETQDLVDMARRTLADRGQDTKFIPTWRGNFGLDTADAILLPSEGARLTCTTFADWLADGAQ